MNNTRTQTSDNVVQHVDDTLRDRDKGWTIIHIDNSITIQNWNVQVKTRFEEFNNSIPQDMYEPIVYQIHQTFAFAKERPALLVSKTSCLYENSKQAVVKSNDTSKSIFNGPTDVALNALNTNAVTGSCKIQFQDNSYNHNKKNFILQIAVFDATNMSKPLIVLQSSAFKVFARKKQDKKRKRSEMESDEQLSLTATFARRGQQDGLGSAFQQEQRPNKVLLVESNKTMKVATPVVAAVQQPVVVVSQEQNLVASPVEGQSVDDVEDFSKKLSQFLTTLDQNKRCQFMDKTVSAFLAVDPQISCRLLFDSIQKVMFKQAV